MSKLAILIPCYNEEEVLPETVRQITLLGKKLVAKGLITPDSYVVFVDDGSRDRTWSIIEIYKRIEAFPELWPSKCFACRSFACR
jgi:glycosyltransferase involved in cell wall biosynthesis